MTATTTTVLRCDGVNCREQIIARPRETDHELRRRAMREQGWRFALPRGRQRDYCRWHA